ncbi:outer membrane beta-barrel protein [Stakelama sp. CBK3Z-3]|uniref:Outer membrane beta-barrel protein n=1 Tax=Stakelama flava TaxID=2860338 RepID=A0ABS6XQ76_9SPHN|nr:OmpW family outer membrane protein [Stakelama flava]MBW4331560.1 outer membrane beta-barrel protein [Stakelama flava]
MRVPSFAITAAAAAALLAPGAALAQDAAPATGIQAGDVLVRARAILVSPNESSSAVEPAFPGSDVGVGYSVMPEVDFTYMATDNIGAELILGTTKHAAQGRGTLGGIDKLASTWVLPPTLTLQYHFNPHGTVRPYLGAGVNYTIFYSEDASDALEAAIGDTKIKMDDSFGYALQAGVDMDLTDRVFVNFDLKYIDMDTTATLNTGGAINQADIHIDPFVVGLGIGTRF